MKPTHPNTNPSHQRQPSASHSNISITFHLFHFVFQLCFLFPSLFFFKQGHKNKNSLSHTPDHLGLNPMAPLCFSKNSLNSHGSATLFTLSQASQSYLSLDLHLTAPSLSPPSVHTLFLFYSCPLKLSVFPSPSHLTRPQPTFFSFLIHKSN